MKVSLTDFFTGERRGSGEGRPVIAPRDIDAILRYYNVRMTSPGAAVAALGRQYPNGDPDTTHAPTDEKVSKRMHEASEVWTALGTKGVRAVAAQDTEITSTAQLEDEQAGRTAEDDIRRKIDDIHAKAGGENV